MRNKTLVAGAGAVLLALMVWWFTSGPQLIIALMTTDGKSSLMYHCTITTDAAEAEARAKAAHVALQSSLSAYAKDAATKAQAALEAYNTNGGDIPNLDVLRRDTPGLRALIAGIKSEYDCNVDL